MLALYLKLSKTYYTENYAGIIGLGLNLEDNARRIMSIIT